MSKKSTCKRYSDRCLKCRKVLFSNKHCPKEYINLERNNITLKTWDLTLDEEEIEVSFDVESFSTFLLLCNGKYKEYALVFGFKNVTPTNVSPYNNFPNCVTYHFEDFKNYKRAYNYVKQAIQNSNFTLTINDSTNSFRKYSLFYS